MLMDIVQLSINIQSQFKTSPKKQSHSRCHSFSLCPLLCAIVSASLALTNSLFLQDYHLFYPTLYNLLYKNCKFSSAFEPTDHDAAFLVVYRSSTYRMNEFCFFFVLFLCFCYSGCQLALPLNTISCAEYLLN